MAAKPIPIEFGTQSDPGRYNPETGPRHINAYIEKVEEGQPNFPIYSIPGLDLFSTISGGGRCRGMEPINDNNFLVISGNVAATIDVVGSATSVGTVTGNTNCTLARNSASPVQVAVVMDGNTFVYSAGTLSPFSDADLPAPNSVSVMDQRAVYTIPDGRFFWSAIDNVTDVSSSSFSTAEGAADGLVRGFSHRLDLWLFGRSTTEIWRSTANADQPFLRQFFIPVGCSAPFSVAEVDDVICWVGHNDIPYIAQGYAPQPLIHGGVSRAIRDTSDKDFITGHGFFEGGYGFWELSGPDWTWVYNLATQKWFEGRSYDLTRSRRQFALRFANSTVVGDYEDGVLYKMNAATFKENGRHLVWSVQSPAMHAYPNRISVDRLYADFVTGVGNANDTDPQVMLEWSDDGGRTFAGPYAKDLGAAGAYGTRVVWSALGTTGRQGRIWRLSVSSPVVRGLKYAAIEGDMIGT